VLIQKGATLAHNLSTSRTGDPNYSDDLLRAVRTAYRRDARAVAEASVFGSRLEHLNQSIDEIRKTQGSPQAQYALEISNMVRGRNLNYSSASLVSEVAYNLSRSFLSFSPLYHAPQMMLNWERFGTVRFLQGVSRSIGDVFKEGGIKAANQFGAIIPRAMNEVYNQSLQDMVDSGAMGPKQEQAARLSKQFGDFFAKPLEYTVNVVRRVGFHVGQAQMEHDLAALQANPGDAKALARIHDLIGQSIPAETLLNLEPKAVEGLMGRAGLKMAHYSGLDFSPLTMPKGANGWFGRLLFQFKNFMFGLTALTHHELMGHDVPIDRRVRALLTFGVGYPIYGVIASYARHVVGADTTNTHALIKALDHANQHPTAANEIAAYTSALASVHALGWYTVLAQTAATGNYQAVRDMDFSLPTLGYLIDIASSLRAGAAAVVNETNGKHASARYQMQKSVEDAGHLLGGAGTVIAHATVGKPKRPTK